MVVFNARSANASCFRTKIWPALTVLVVSFSFSSTPAANAGEAFGGGVAIVPDSHTEYFEFNVTETGDGNAQGNIVFSARDDGGILFISHLRADCICFLDERTALVACTVVNDTDPEFIGTTATFTVRDNGDGPDAPPDEFTGVFYALNNPNVDEWTCESVLEFLADRGTYGRRLLNAVRSGKYPCSALRAWPPRELAPRRGLPSAGRSMKAGEIMTLELQNLRVATRRRKLNVVPKSLRKADFQSGSGSVTLALENRDRSNDRQQR